MRNERIIAAGFEVEIAADGQESMVNGSIPARLGRSLGWKTGRKSGFKDTTHTHGPAGSNVENSGFKHNREKIENELKKRKKTKKNQRERERAHGSSPLNWNGAISGKVTERKLSRIFLLCVYETREKERE